MTFLVSNEHILRAEQDQPGRLMAAQRPPLKDQSPSLKERSPSLKERSPSLIDQSPSLQERSNFFKEQRPSLEERRPSLEEQRKPWLLLLGKVRRKKRRPNPRDNGGVMAGTRNRLLAPVDALHATYTINNESFRHNEDKVPSPQHDLPAPGGELRDGAWKSKGSTSLKYDLRKTNFEDDSIRMFRKRADATSPSELSRDDPSAFIASDLPITKAQNLKSTYIKTEELPQKVSTKLQKPNQLADIQQDAEPQPSEVRLNANDLSRPNAVPPPEIIGDAVPAAWPPASPNFYLPKIYRKPGGGVAYPGYDVVRPLYCGHPHHGGANTSRPPDGAFFQVGAEGARADEVVLVVIVLMLWLGAISMFINRWGKLRMLEPYQPAYSAPPAAPSRPPTLGGANPTLGTASNGGGPTINIQNSSEAAMGRPKRIDSLNSFRDNFREGYRDAYRYWGLAPKPTLSPKTFSTGLGISSMTGMWGLGSSPLGIGLGNLAGMGEFRRASSGSALGADECRRGSRSHSISGSTQHLHHLHHGSHHNLHGSHHNLHGSHHNLLSSHHGSHHNLLGSHHGSHHNLHGSHHHNPPIINIADTSITVTNTDDDSTSNSNSRNNSMTDLRGAGCGGECCCNQAGCGGVALKPLASQIKVRSAVDLVTLVMQEKKRNFM